MLPTFESLDESPVVESYTVLDFQSGTGFYYIKCKVRITNGSCLFLKEYHSTTVVHYAYHWQDASGEMITRWDNAPHHPEIDTYPHHKHQPDVASSTIKGLSDVLEEIEGRLRGNR